MSGQAKVQENDCYLLGAFYLHQLLHGHPAAKITISEESGATAIALHRTGEANPGDLINITTTHPWPGPDPRGPGKESTLWTFDPVTKRPVASRPPCQLQTILHRKDLHDTRFIDRAAQTAAHRLDRELERGYAEIRPTPLPAEHYARDDDQPMLPLHAATHRTLADAVRMDIYRGRARQEREFAGFINTITTNETKPITPEELKQQFARLWTP